MSFCRYADDGKLEKAITIDARVLEISEALSGQFQRAIGCLRLRLEMIGHPADGFVSGSSLRQALELEDKVIARLGAGELSAFHAASINGIGYRETIIIGNDMLAVSRVCSPIDAGSDFWATLTEESEAREYILDLTPDRREWREALNNAIHAQLQEHGDDGTSLREITHFIYGSAASLSEVRARLTRDMGSIEMTADRLLLLEIGSLEEPALSERAMELELLAEECGATYDGWEAVVVTGQASAGMTH